MRRQLVPTCLLLGAALLAPALICCLRSGERAAAALEALRPAAAARGGRAAPISDARACKPQPPVATTLAQLGADGDMVQLSFSVTPHADAAALRWALVLPPGAQLLDGPASGVLPAGSAGTGPLVARVKLPPDGEQVTLAVDGALAISAGPTAVGGREPLAVRRALTWTPPSLGPLAAEHESRTPVRHREGR